MIAWFTQALTESSAVTIRYFVVAHVLETHVIGDLRLDYLVCVFPVEINKRAV